MVEGLGPLGDNTVPVDFPATVRFNGNPARDAWVEAMSARLVHLRCDDPIEAGTWLSIKLRSERIGRPVFLSAHVMRSRPLPGGGQYSVRCRFA